MNLSNEQQQVFDKYIQGENIFITGPGGTGKTALIRSIYKHAISTRKNIQVCALTGCASILLECRAKTIHSWSGIGLGQGEIDAIIKKVIANRNKTQPWKIIDILIIDEVSMMSKKLFDTLNLIGKITRKSYQPFGGIQVIFSGDFYQLPPVGIQDEPDTSRFCFESEDWSSTFQTSIALTQIFRQNDPIYISVLNQIREGKLKRRSIELLQGYVNRPLPPTKPTKLYPTRNQVDKINNNEMLKLTGDEFQFKTRTHYDLPIVDKKKPSKLSFSKEAIDQELERMKNSIMCDPITKLKVGTQVMCVVNTEDYGVPLCNGSQGTVIGFVDEYPNIQFVQLNRTFDCVIKYYTWSSENIEGIGISQIPLIHSWALTIHKSQGTTLDIAEIDVGNGIFECGQTYVALSRIKSLDGLFLSSFDYTKIKINRKVRDFYKQTMVAHCDAEIPENPPNKEDKEDKKENN
jgi:ATP-dependent DNA helicase PIF1